MNASTWIELAGLALGGGGGATAVAKLTRLVVAVEHLAEKIEVIAEGADKTAQQVTDHEIRLAKGGL
jgi:hypothetical protein